MKPQRVYRTQKAAGLDALTRWTHQVRGNLSSVLPPAIILQDDADVAAYIYSPSTASSLRDEGRFVRPCPVTPRHGFEDSRLVHTSAGVLERWFAARDADPNAELIVMPFLNPVCSAIVNPDAITLGTSNDGATGGHAGSWVLPFNQSIELASNLLKAARVNLADGQTWFAELVQTPISAGMSDREYRFCVQLRAGERSGNFQTVDELHGIDSLTVAHVLDGSQWLTPGFDDWKLIEDTVQAARVIPGAILWLPNAPISCHPVIQANCNKVPFTLRAEKPAIGQIFTASTSTLELADNDRLIALLGGIRHALSETLPADTGESYSNAGRYINALCVALHHQVAWSKTFAGCTALGIACGYMLKFGMAAGWGESRHAKGTTLKPSGHTRRQIYRFALESSTFNHRETLPRLLELFALKKWSGSYGGMAWARCTAALAELDLSIAQAVRHLYAPVHPGKVATRVKLARETSPADHLSAIFSALNTTVHEAHNSGWWLNKFATPDVLNHAAVNNPAAVISAAFTLYASSLSTPLANAFAPFLAHKHETAKFLDLIANVRTTAKATKVPAVSKQSPYTLPDAPDDEVNSMDDDDSDTPHPLISFQAFKKAVLAKTLQLPKGATPKILALTTDSHVQAYPIDNLSAGHPGYPWHFQAKTPDGYISWDLKPDAVHCFPTDGSAKLDIETTIRSLLSINTNNPCVLLSMSGSGVPYLKLTPGPLGFSVTFNGHVLTFDYTPMQSAPILHFIDSTVGF